MGNEIKRYYEKVDANKVQDKLQSLRDGKDADDSFFGKARNKLESVAKEYNDFRTKYVDGPLTKVEGLVNTIGHSVDAIVAGATTGVLESEVFPKDYARELCFRMDFYEYDRSDRFSKAKSTPKASVILPLPRNIATQTSVGYSTESLGLGGVVENALRGVDGTVDGQTGVEALKSIAKQIGGVAGNVTESLGLKAANALSEGTIGAVAGFTPNPHLATLFTGMDIRNFSFSIQCTATSPEDSAALQNVIKTIKKYALPALSPKRISLSYPHEVFISFSEAGYADPPRTPLDNIFRFKRCVLKSVNVTVGSQGTPSFFNNLEPTEMTIDLEFTETQIETAQDYGGGQGAEDISDQIAEAAKGIGSSAIDLGKKVADSISPSGTGGGDT